MATYAPPGMRRPTAQVRRPVPQAQGIGAPQVAGTRDPGGNQPQIAPRPQASDTFYGGQPGGFGNEGLMNQRGSQVDSNAMTQFGGGSQGFYGGGQPQGGNTGTGLPPWVGADGSRSWVQRPGDTQQGGGRSDFFQQQYQRGGQPGIGIGLTPSQQQQQRQGQQFPVLSPEQRWAQQPGAMPWTQNMTGDENKANLTNQLWNQFNLGVQPQDNASGFYNGIGDFARQGIGNVNPYQGGQSPYAGQAADIFNQYSGQRAPNPIAAPFSYDTVNAPQYNAPQYDETGRVQFDPSSIGGPQMSGISDINQNFNRFNAAGIGGPQNRNISGANQGAFNQYQGGFDQLRNDIIGGGNVPRENIQGSGFQGSELFGNPNSVASQGFQSALGGAQKQIGAGLNQDIFKQQARALQNELKTAGIRSNVLAGEEVGGRGIVYTPGASGVSDEAYAKYYAPEQGRIGTALADLAAGNLDRTIQQQQFGIGAATGLGSAASNAAQGNAGLLQSDNQFVGQSGITQRGQDIQQGQARSGNLMDVERLRQSGFQANTDRGQTISQLQQQADEAMARGDREGYQAATQRIAAMGDINNQENTQSRELQQLQLQAEQARRSGDIDAYNSLTQRINTLGNQATSQYNAETGRYEANTGRGRVNADAANAAARLNYDYAGLNQRYAEMGANNIARFNEQMLNAFSGDTDRLQVMTNGMTRLAELDQQGQIEAGRQAIEYGGLMAQLLRDGSNVTQAADQLAMQAQQGNRDAFIELYTFLAGQGSQRQMNRENNRFNPGQALTNIVGGAVQGYSGRG